MLFDMGKGGEEVGFGDSSKIDHDHLRDNFLSLSWKLFIIYSRMKLARELKCITRSLSKEKRREK